MKANFLKKSLTVVLSSSLAACTVSSLPALSNSTGAFIESNGVVVVEMESTNYSGSWKLVHGGNAIEWMGNDEFNKPGKGVIDIKVKITNPGIYQFDWANKIGEGSSTTEANDSWLKIESDKFYGDNGITIVCPKGMDTAKNTCIGELPEGAGQLGWFKAYRSGGEVSEFIWSTNTSDNDPHKIYAQFNHPGIYTVQISGRSKHHIIDRFIMTKDAVMHELVKHQDESVRE
ncbi:hypothetical protein WNY51_05235 [Pseudocolwellia sp. AS88]|uniref:hypothetical protein n=1 Tax=Pseudocolwellia sp. AS88 TaxID=3063958 RepID=UPI0026F06790|nr:hypothetical protein [Pseudocolwellia sp. AS88]MDO7083510.1 hypothetical protein [Pseudocolwellia sp. AS88]